MIRCPCGTELAFDDCCGRFVSSSQVAPSAEALMRSRFVAYTLRNEAYLLASWHPDTRPAMLELDKPPQPKWIDLKVLRHEQTDDAHATVEFVARYKINGKAGKLHEISRFEKIEGRWLYRDGITPPVTD